MNQSIAKIALLVDEYDKAIEFYTKKLNFILIEDIVMSETKRWVVIAPDGPPGCCLLLAKAATEEQQSKIGNQSGGRVFLFLHTDDLERDHQNMIQKGIRFVRGPVVETWGKVAVFEDLYGNLWDLIEPADQ